MGYVHITLSEEIEVGNTSEERSSFMTRVARELKENKSVRAA